MVRLPAWKPVAAALLFATVPLPAHHAFSAEYDANKRITVSGAVTEFKWTNPHVWVYLDVKDASGSVTRWSFEMGSPAGLQRRGWTKAELKEGDQITVEGFGSKDGRNVANAGAVTLPDGRKLFGGFQSTPGAPPKPGK